MVKGIFLNEGLLEALGMAPLQDPQPAVPLEGCHALSLLVRLTHLQSLSKAGFKGATDHINIRISHSGSKDHKGDTRNHGLWDGALGLPVSIRGFQKRGPVP